MVVISVYIYRVKIIKKSGGKMVFSRGGPWNTPYHAYALTEVRGTLCS